MYGVYIHSMEQVNVWSIHSTEQVNVWSITV